MKKGNICSVAIVCICTKSALERPKLGKKKEKQKEMHIALTLALRDNCCICYLQKFKGI